jgi:soluble lytic murein transglycosylase-like protein
VRKSRNEFTINIGTAIPVFLGVLGSMMVCAIISIHGPAAFAVNIIVPVPEKIVESVQFKAAVINEEKADAIQALYANLDTRDQVADFFAAFCGSPIVADVILANAAAQNISPSLAFALCWEESRFKPHAINAKNRDESIDRGLFQLNSNSFPKLAVADFYDPAINAQYGMSHLRFCLDIGGTEIAALAMYNAGTGRVRSLGAPKMTLDYIHRILETRRKIELSFEAAILEPVSENVAVKAPNARPYRLSPLSGRR